MFVPFVFMCVYGPREEWELMYVIAWVCAWHKMITLMRRWQRASEILMLVESMFLFLDLNTLKRTKMQCNAFIPWFISIRSFYMYHSAFISDECESNWTSYTVDIRKKTGMLQKYSRLKKTKRRNQIEREKKKMRIFSQYHLKPSSPFCNSNNCKKWYEKLKIEFRTNLCRVHFEYSTKLGF